MNPPVSSVHIAVVEDNDTLRELLVSYLAQPGRHIHAADCGEQLDELLEKYPLHIVVLDLNLPYEDGFSIARRLRRSHPQIKIAMLTARVRGADRTGGYEAGADVYLTKPTNVTELDAVIRNLSSRMDAPAPLNSFQLNRKAQVLTSPLHKQLVLTAAECSILVQLALATEEGVATDRMLGRLSSEARSELTRENLTVLISRLRSKLETQLDAGQLIQTIRNHGYRLTLPLVVT